MTLQRFFSYIYKYNRVLSVLVLAVTTLSTLVAGYIPVRNFSIINYKGGTQNWDVAQDSLGRIYVANNEGMLAFDGMRWNLYPISNYTAVRSLLYDHDSDRIYAGGSGEFGYFETGPSDLVYVSLVPKLENFRNGFSEIWNIMHVGKAVWFQADNYIFRFDGNKVVAVSSPGRISCSAVINGELILALDNGVLLSFNGNSFSEIKGTGKLSGKKIAALAEGPATGSCLIATSVDGLYMLDGDGVNEYYTEIDDFLRKNQIFSVSHSDGKYVFGTVDNGAVVYDVATRRVNYINKENSLQNNTVLSSGFDRAGNIWLCLDNGLDYALFSSPVTDLIGAGSSIGAGYVSLRSGDVIYLGTNQGLYSVRYPFSGSPNAIPLNMHMHGQIWSVAPDDRTVVVCGDGGLFVGSAGNFSKISGISGAYRFEKLPQYDSVALVSAYDGFHLMRKQGNSWIDKGRVAGYDDIGGSFRLDSNGNIWLSHFRKGIYRLHLDVDRMKFDRVQLFDITKGLPDNHNNAVEIFNGEPVFSTNHGFYIFDSLTQRIVRDTFLTASLTSRTGSKLVNLGNGDLMLVGKNLSLARKNASGDYETDSVSFVTPQNLLIPGFDNFCYISEHELLASNQKGFWIIDTEKKRLDRSIPKVFVSYIRANRDSVVYRACGLSGTSEKLELTYDLNSVVIEFGYPDFAAADNIEFSSMLENYDEDWTPFGTEAKREYTHLGPGEYSLRLRARDTRSGQISESSFPFHILPPWYLSLPAKIVYAILIIVACCLMFMALKKWNLRTKRKIEERKEKEMAQLREKNKRDALEKDFEIATLKSEQLEKDIRHKSSELSNTTMNLIRKNEILSDIHEKLTKVQDSLVMQDGKDALNVRRQLALIKSTINDNISHDDDFERFTGYFDIVYVDFTKNLIKLHPNLSLNDKRLCCYIKMGLSSKEIAPLINISYKSVEMARYRLRKKMDLSAEVNLVEYLQNI